MRLQRNFGGFMPAALSGEQIEQITHLIGNKNYSNRKIAVIVGVSHVTIGYYRKKVEQLGITSEFLLTLDYDEKQQLFHPNYPYRQSKKASVDFLYHLKEINKYNGKKGSPNKKSAWEKEREEKGDNADCLSGFYKKFNAFLKVAGAQPSLPQFYQPGEVFFCDFVGPKLAYGPNDEFEANFAAGCFGYSKYVSYQATDFQTTYDWGAFIQKQFKAANGPTIRVVHDNTTALVRIKDSVRTFNKTYQMMYRHHGFIPCPIPRKSPQFNALAEISVKIFETEILPILRAMKFNTLVEMNEVIDKHTYKINHRILSGDIESRYDKYVRDEMPALQDYPDKDFEFPLKTRDIKVPKTWNFSEDGVKYPIPHNAKIKRVILLVRKQEIEVQSNGKTLCIHERLRPGRRHLITPDHLPKKFQKYYIETEAYFVAWAEKLDSAVVELIQAQFNGVSFPDYKGRNSCMKIQKLCTEDNERQFIECCDFVVTYGELTYEELSEAMECKVTDDEVVDRCLDLFKQVHKKHPRDGGRHYAH